MSIERLKELFHELDCVRYGTFKLASGEISNYKIVCDSLFENSEAREIVSRLGYQLLQEIEIEREYEIVGVVTGGCEFAKLVAEKAGRMAVAVNPHSGETLGEIEKEHICYFDDVVTKGGSILKCHKILETPEGGNRAIAIIDREEGAEENLSKNGIKLKRILTKSDLGA